MESAPTFVRNSYAVVELLQTLRQIPPDAVWLVADVDQLYPSILVDEAFSTIRDLLYANDVDHNENSPAVQLVLALLKIHLNYNFWNSKVNAGFSRKGFLWAKLGPQRSRVYL